MRLILDIPNDKFNDEVVNSKCVLAITETTTNGEVIKAMFGADKVFGFIHYVHLMAKVGNWFNEGVVAEFDKDWWNSPYQKGGKE